MSTQPLSIVVAHGGDAIRKDLVEAINSGHRVIAECGTIAELKSTVLSQRPDLLVTGVYFPDGDGISTAIELGETEPLPCVVSTAARSLDLVHKAMEDHVMAYLIEPVTNEELAAAIIVAWSRFEQLRELELQVEDLKTALHHRKIIERAKGVLMAEKSMTEREAFNELRREAQNDRRPMIDIANRILDRSASNTDYTE